MLRRGLSRRQTGVLHAESRAGSAPRREAPLPIAGFHDGGRPRAGARHRPNVVVFSITNALLIRPLQSSAPGELVGVYARDRERPGSYRPFSLEDLDDLRGAGDVFDRVAGLEMVVLGTTEGETTRRTFGTVVSADYFATLGATLALGRPFAPAEERPG